MAANRGEGVRGGVGRRDAVMLVAAFVALAGLGFALRPQHTTTIAVTPAAVAIDRPTGSSTRRPTVLVIGDAYSSGSGLAETSYACRAATRMGWLCKLAAEPGTGYISGGTANRFSLDQGSGKSTSFGERISALGSRYQPDVVILDGGRYDVFVPPAERFDVTASTIWQVQQTWPNARIVYVKPRFLAKPDDDLGVTGGVAAALKNGKPELVIVDPIARFAGKDTRGLISSDGTDPNNKGAQELAAALADELTKNGVPPSP